VKYPSGFTLYTDVSKVTNLTYAPVCDDKMVICLYFPKEMYPGTDFEGAGVSVNVLSQYNTESKCSVFNPAVFPPERLTGKKRINDIAFETAFGGGAGLGHSQENHFYRTFHNERCFEIDLVININDIIRSDIEYGDRMGKVVDENEVLEKLNQILSTFKFIK
jgi:hypothetical protein